MWNDKESDLDLLGHKRIAQTIVGIMDEHDLRPLTLGVYGSWGAGKSSVLSLIKSELKTEEETLTITFNGWLFQGYEDTRSALMETIIAELVRLQPTEDKIAKLGKSLLQRVNWLKVAKIGGGLAFTAMTGMPDPSLWGIPGMLTKLKDALSSKSESAEGTKVEITQPSEGDNILKDIEDTVPGQIHAFRKELGQLIETSKVKRVVVLVDELDRCLPAAVIDILEAIRLFLFVEGTVFVIAADEQMIEYSVRRHFPDLSASQAEYTKHYLEKLVQIPIRVPSLNQLQTKNYIRFLLLQHQLQNDKARLKEIYHAFEESVDTPYENKDVTYDFLCEQLGSTNSVLQEALLVAEQLGAVLSEKLRGNPRNIKRFLNTVYLRLRVAKIYKIEDKVNLDVLAKLMLLERFYYQDYDKVVNEVASSESGKSDTIANLEDGLQEGKNEKAATETIENLTNWARLTPALKDTDLRPYLFVSRERAIGFASSDNLPHALHPIFDALTSGSSMAMAAKDSDVAALSSDQVVLIFDELKKASHRISDWSSMHNPMKGILHLMRQRSEIEERVVQIIDNVPENKLKLWMISNLNNFETDTGKEALKALLVKVKTSTQAESRIISLASQLYNKTIMGTSTNRNRLKPSIPLIPDWIEQEPTQASDSSNQLDQDQSPLADSSEPNDVDNDTEDAQANEVPEVQQSDQPVNRFNQSQRGFRKAIKSNSGSAGATERVLKNYITHAGGGSKNMAKRMQRSAGAVARFGYALTEIQRNGLATQLITLNLAQYINKPAIDVLGALMDVICGASPILDDAITKQAYSNTIIRLDDENPNLDLDNLNNNQVNNMLAIFLEETIVYRVIADVGRSLTTATHDVEKSRQMEEDLYQIINGLIHSTIIPEINNALSSLQNLEQAIENIYKIAFETVIG